MSNILILVASIVSGLATVAIAFLALYSYQLNKSLSNKSEQHEQVMKDLLNAMVIALLSAPHGGEAQNKGMIRFKQHYKGKTPILQNE